MQDWPRFSCDHISMKLGGFIVARALGGLIVTAPALASAATPIALPACPAPPQPIAGAPTAAILRTAVIDDCLTVRGQEMAARVIDTRLAVSVEVNGSGPFRFLVD